MKEMILEFLPVVLLLPLTLTIHFVDIKPLQQGFFCDDYTLKYPIPNNSSICLFYIMDCNKFIHNSNYTNHFKIILN